MSLRRGFGNPLPPRSPCPQPCHLRGHPALIQKNQTVEREVLDLLAKGLALLPSGLAVTFLGVEGFFLPPPQLLHHLSQPAAAQLHSCLRQQGLA
jgi:hypothetical protein